MDCNLYATCFQPNIKIDLSDEKHSGQRLGFFHVGTQLLIGRFARSPNSSMNGRDPGHRSGPPKDKACKLLWGTSEPRPAAQGNNEEGALPSPCQPAAQPLALNWCPIAAIHDR